MLSFDTETTGLDLWHGCLPYSMQLVDHTGQAWFCEWPVDPITRIPDIQAEDLEFFADKFQNDELVAHNCKFDLLAFDTACRHVFGYPLVEWVWSYVHDTMIKFHVIRNLYPHGLKDLREIFLGVTRRRQDALKYATDKARRIVRSKRFVEEHGVWSYADEGHPHWPGTKKPKEKDDDIEGWWLFDTWLPATIARLTPDFLPPENEWQHSGTYDQPDWFLHPWDTVAKSYAMEDPITTLVLNELADEILAAEGLTHISQTRHKLNEVTYSMESHGTTINLRSCQREIERYLAASEEHTKVVVSIATKFGFEEYNPDSAQQTTKLLYDTWKLPVLKETESKAPSTDAETIKNLQDLVNDDLTSMEPSPPPESKTFLTSFLSRKQNAKAADYIDQYRRWSVSHGPVIGARIHPSYLITGTKFTRQSTSGPNMQNVGTGKNVYDENGNLIIDFLTRNVFAPRPGEVWLSIDFQSIEFFIWGFSCGNEEIQDCYHQGISPFKPIMEAVWGYFDKEDKKYKRVKNGIYSKIYGSGKAHSDITFGKQGAVDLIENRMPEVKEFANARAREVRKNGFITTRGGYRLFIEEQSPHKATSAYIQGHAGWVIGEAMIACHRYLRRFPEIKIILQIHDELVFCGPTGFEEIHGPPLARCMRDAGEKFGIPTPVNMSLITPESTWGNPQPLNLTI